ncbi:hypothetical protein CDAR_297701 [Caerostris darwini]|uniref:TFIID subunit TAF5 NTD2 domain-containing protein n=1 Tax=Caerostris darwini TaxID=1538125 RepID=A0AAV4PQ44_9ARAC|nr:hypothetical protein CDAR_297701 [Caerostris darwini]
MSQVNDVHETYSISNSDIHSELSTDFLTANKEYGGFIMHFMQAAESLRNQAFNFLYPFYVYIYLILLKEDKLLDCQKFATTFSQIFANSKSFEHLIEDLSKCTTLQDFQNHSYFKNFCEHKFTVEMNGKNLKLLKIYLKETHSKLLLTFIELCIEVVDNKNNLQDILEQPGVENNNQTSLEQTGVENNIPTSLEQPCIENNHQTNLLQPDDECNFQTCLNEENTALTYIETENVRQTYSKSFDDKNYLKTDELSNDERNRRTTFEKLDENYFQTWLVQPERECNSIVEQSCEESSFQVIKLSNDESHPQTCSEQPSEKNLQTSLEQSDDESDFQSSLESSDNENLKTYLEQSDDEISFQSSLEPSDDESNPEIITLSSDESNTKIYFEQPNEENNLQTSITQSNDKNSFQINSKKSYDESNLQTSLKQSYDESNLQTSLEQSYDESNSQTSLEQSIDETNLQHEDISDYVYDGKLKKPSSYLYTISCRRQNVHCVDINKNNTLLACGFKNYNIHVWNLDPNVLKSGEAENESKLYRTDLDSSKEGFSSNLSFGSSHKFKGHYGSVSGLAYTPFDSVLLSCSKDATVRVWSIKDFKSLHVYSDDDYPIWDITACDFYAYFLTGSMNRTASLWSFERSTPVRIFPGHSFGVKCVRFHPNCKFIATASAKTLHMWSMQNGQSLRKFSGHEACINCVAFSPNGKLVASADDRGCIKIWDIGSGQLFSETKAHSNKISSISFDKSCSLIASAGYDNLLKVWDVKYLYQNTNEREEEKSALVDCHFRDSLIHYVNFNRNNPKEKHHKDMLLSVAALQK